MLYQRLAYYTMQWYAGSPHRAPPETLEIEDEDKNKAKVENPAYVTWMRPAGSAVSPKLAFTGHTVSRPGREHHC